MRRNEQNVVKKVLSMELTDIMTKEKLDRQRKRGYGQERSKQ